MLRRIDVVTLFPRELRELTGLGVTGRALHGGPVELGTWNPRDYATDRHRSNPVTHLDPSDPPGYVLAGVNDGIVPVGNVQAFHRHARSMGLDGDLRVTVDIVDHLADGRPIAPSVIGQPDPRNHCPVGGMNAALFDLWLDDR